MEREERQFYKEVEKERVERQKKEEQNKFRHNEKENSIRKFFPESNSSPGGTFRLHHTSKEEEGGKRFRYDRMLRIQTCKNLYF